MKVEKCMKAGKPAFRLGKGGKAFSYTKGNSLSMKRAFGILSKNYRKDISQANRG
jgi:hypothetical protein